MNEGDDFCMDLTKNTPVRNVFNNKLAQAICVFAVKLDFLLKDPVPDSPTVAGAI